MLPTSAYSLTNLPAGPGCPSPRHPTTCNIHYPLRVGKCKCLLTPTLTRKSSASPLDRPDWRFLPLAGTYAIISKGKTLQSPNQAHHIGILGALGAWRVTQGIYRFDPTTFDAIWKTPVTGDIPTKVLFPLPEWCVYIPTP